MSILKNLLAFFGFSLLALTGTLTHAQIDNNQYLCPAGYKTHSMAPGPGISTPPFTYSKSECEEVNKEAIEEAFFTECLEFDRDALVIFPGSWTPCMQFDTPYYHWQAFRGALCCTGFN